MTDSRRAALTLYALADTDRAWVLQRLDPPSRQRLQAHLLELAELGIPADGALIDEALAVSPALAEDDWRGQLSMRSAETVAGVLATEPTGVVAAVLAAGPWRWESALWTHLPHRREAVQAARSQLGADRHELNEWLARQVELHCAARCALPPLPLLAD